LNGSVFAHHRGPSPIVVGSADSLADTDEGDALAKMS
jgi:hypothetical protein